MRVKQSFFKFLDATHLILYMTDNFIKFLRITIGILQNRDIATHTELFTRKKLFNGQNDEERTNVKYSEVVVIESTDVRDFYVFHVLLSKLEQTSAVKNIQNACMLYLYSSVRKERNLYL